MSTKDLYSRYVRLRSRFHERDIRMEQVKAIREGRINEVAPDLFPTAGPFQQPIVANMIDVAARDMAEKVAPLPSFNCASPSTLSEASRKKATLKTKIAMGYVTNSNLQVQMYDGADKYITYGFLPIRVELDYETNMPFVRVLDPMNSYPEIDRFGRVRAFFQRALVHVDEFLTLYPEQRAFVEANYTGGSPYLEVIFFHDDKQDAVLLGGATPITVDSSPNLAGKCLVRVAKRPGVTEVPRGQFDDVMFVQLAKARFALLALQAAHESVNSPLIVPSDVPEIPIGPGATIRTNNPQGVGRVPLSLPSEAFSEQAQLDRELTLGSRFPEARTGSMDASIITGKGVTALMDGYDSQIRSHQAVFAATLQEVVSLAFEVDERVFGNVTKRLRGSANGTPYEITYTPKPAINGDYTVDVAYGLMAGLDPNRWLVFSLQARAEKLFSRDLMRREMPLDIDAEEEARKVDLEDLEESAKAAIQGYASAIPQLAAAGQDPSGAVEALGKVIELRRKGKSISEAVSAVFQPPPPPEAAPATPEELMDQAMGTPDGAPQPGQEMLPPESQNVVGQPPSGRPDLATMLAGLDAKGQPTLSGGVMRSRVI